VRLLLTIGAYLGSLALVAIVMFFAMIVLVGPHGGLLSAAFEKPLLVLGWVTVLLLPAWVAYKIWYRLTPKA